MTIYKTSAKALSSNTEAVIFDVNGTVKDEEPVEKHVGKKLLWSQLRSGHPLTFFKGCYDFVKVKNTTRHYGIKGDAYGLREFFELTTNDMKLNPGNLYKLTYEALVENEIQGFSEFNKALQDRGIKTFFSTISYDFVGKVGMDIYDLSGYVANPTRWRNPDGSIVTGSEVVYKGLGERSVSINEDAILEGLSMPLMTAGDKRVANCKLMEKAGINKRNVAMVGNDRLDRPSMEYFGLAMASPFAKRGTVKLVKKLDGIVIGDYYTAMDSLLKEDFRPRRL